MKFINKKINATNEEVLEFIRDSTRVNAGVKFDEKRGTPLIHLKEKQGKVKMTCEMINRPTKDNGFLVGTYFKGKLTEKDGVTELRGVIVTAPIYHLFFGIMLAVLIWQCFYYTAISALPILFVAAEIIMFSGEFKKQGVIEKYINRAFFKLNAEKNRLKKR